MLRADDEQGHVDVDAAERPRRGTQVARGAGAAARVVPKGLPRLPVPGLTVEVLSQPPGMGSDI